MRALRSFTVRPRLPEPLAQLLDLAMNLRWSWDERTRDLFRAVDPDVWEVTGHDPVRLLGRVSRERLEELSAETAFVSFMTEVHDELQRYLENPRWFQGRSDTPLRAVAYFSPEFGIAEAIPQYSGGLGVLAGDHLKAASALGVPLIGVGLLYRQGYFRQELDAEGWQRERYADLDPYAMALTPVEGTRIEVRLAGTPTLAQVWRGQVGRVTLYLLDTDVEENDEEGRAVTDRLYGGEAEHRIRQEILLGIGGRRALDALGEPVQVFHTNEGHAGFLGLDNIRRLVTQEGLTLAEAVEAVRAATVFTTHTPVPAGIDRFPRELMERYFKEWAEDAGLAFEDLMGLGHEPGEDAGAPFNMAVMGLRLAGRSNGVSRLHRDVSRRMFASLWPGIPSDEVPITSVTNGVHALTWVSPEMGDLLDRYVLPEWHEAGPDRWVRLDEARDDELWHVRQQGRERLIAFVRRRLLHSEMAKGLSESDAAWCEHALDPAILTIGFARRFAAYKRATLLLSQPERLEALLLSEEQPLQLLFAGKAHPADDLGKQMIRQIVQFSRRPRVRHRIAFIEDYDIAVARMLYQGSDVWLNVPRRPMEACGTSGMKAALNGALNCSILDGWWDEMFDGDNGWAISSVEANEDHERRDASEAERLFEMLEGQIVPLFYDRDRSGVPHRWLERVRASLRSLGPEVSASRMMRDYAQDLYEPTAARTDSLSAGSYARARALSKWKKRVRKDWKGLHVADVNSETGVADLGAVQRVEATVALGRLLPEDVEVQVIHGAVGPNDELHEPTVTAMSFVGLDDSESSYRFEASFTCERAGRYGFTVRVVPAHPDLVTATELGQVAWA